MFQTYCGWKQNYYVVYCYVGDLHAIYTYGSDNSYLLKGILLKVGVKWSCIQLH